MDTATARPSSPRPVARVTHLRDVTVRMSRSKLVRHRPTSILLAGPGTADATNSSPRRPVAHGPARAARASLNIAAFHGRENPCSATQHNTHVANSPKTATPQHNRAKTVRRIANDHLPAKGVVIAASGAMGPSWADGSAAPTIKSAETRTYRNGTSDVRVLLWTYDTRGGIESLMGLAVQLQALGLYTGNTQLNLSSLATWSTTNPAVATVAPGGLVTCVGAGSASKRSISR